MSSDWEDYNQLMKALQQGKKEEVKCLLQNDIRVNKIPEVYKVSTPLHLAVTLGCPEIVKLLLDKKANVNVENVNCETPLIMAAKMGKNLIADYLLSVTDQTNLSNKENLSHMHIACMRNKVDVVKKLIQQGAKINQTIKPNSLHWPGFTPLHFAAYYQCVETVEFLLSCGADITIEDAKQLTPLHYADIVRNETIIDMILSVHQYTISNPVNSEGLSHFHIACTRNNPSIVECFLQQGVDIDMQVYPISLNWTNCTPINFAIYYECTDVLRLLLLYKVFVNESSVEYAYRIGNKDIINILLSKEKIQKTKKKRSNAKKIRQYSDFNNACKQKNLVKIENSIPFILSKKFLKSELPLWANCTPLHIAIKNQCVEAVRLLLQHYANIITIKDVKGKTSLHLAFETKQWTIVDIILSAHVNVNENPTDNEGLSHFHIACTRDNLKTINFFLQNGVNVNKTVDSNSIFWSNYTPLHFATEFEEKDVVQILLKHDADVTIKNGIGLTPLDIAINSLDSNKRFMILKTDEFDIIHSILSHLSVQSTSSNGKFDSFDDRGFTLLHVASTDFNMNTLKNILDSYPETIDKPISWIDSEWSGFTPLHLAAHWCNIPAIEILIDKGANISVKNGAGDTPVHVAYNASHFADVGETRLIFTNDNPIGSNDYSHFHIACLIGNIEAVEYFLDHGVNVNEPIRSTHFKNNGKTPLHLAVDTVSVYDKIVKILIKNGANIHARDAELNTPLHCTQENYGTENVRILLNEGVDVNAINIYNETALYKTCCGEIADAGIIPLKIRLLLEYGADINIANDEGETPLMLIESCSESCHDKLISAAEILKHIRKLKIVHYYVNKKNEKAYRALLEKCQLKGYYKEIEFSQQCLKEVQQMVNIHIDNYTTLRDILYKSANNLALHSENATFQKIINSKSLHEVFPIYGFLLKLQFKKGLTRKPLLEISKRSLNILTIISLPDACLEKILYYLDNNDLQNIIISTEYV